MKILVDKQLYRPGSVVKGKLLLDYISRSYNVKYIKLNASGTSKVRLAPSPLEVHTRCEKYLDITFYLWKRNESLKDGLPPGAHEFPFEFPLPTNIPSSFEGRYGWIRYTIKVWVSTSGLLKKGTGVSTNIHVQRSVNVLYPELQTHHHVERDVAGGLFKFSGRIKFTVQLPRTGYLIGEVVPLNGHFMSTSTSNVSLCLYFIQHTKYTIDESKSATTTYLLSVIPNVFSHRGTCQTTWACSGLRIPNTIVPSGSTLPIDVQYSIKVSMFASGTAKNATVVIPITVGSQTAPVHPEEDTTVAVNASFPSTTSLNPSLYLPTSSTYPATSRSPHLSPSTLPTYLPTSVNPSQRLSMPSINPAQTSTSYEETSSIGINSPPASPRPTTSSFSEMHLPNTHSHVTGSLPHLGGNTGAWQTTSANNNSETEMLPPSYDQLFPI